MPPKALKTKAKADPGKRKRDREGSTRALLEAAIAVFSERGYDAATTREVAQRAKVSEALIQRYFEGKAGLLLAIMEMFASDPVETSIAVMPFRKSLKEEIKQILSETCGMYEEGSNFIRVALSRALVDPKLANQLRIKVHERRLPAMVARLLHYQQTGLVRKDVDLHALAFAISSMGFSMGFMAKQVFSLPPETVTRMTDQMADVLCDGAVPPKK